MFPLFAVHNLIDCRTANAVHSAKFSLSVASGGVSDADLDRMGVRQLGLSASLAARLAPLFVPVVGIVGAGAKKEVGRINAKSIIAVMQDTDAVGNRADAEFIGDTMRGHGSAMQAKLAVPISAARSRPRPALANVDNDNLVPKTDFVFRGKIVHSAFGLLSQKSPWVFTHRDGQIYVMTKY